jgi:type II secretory pathway component PulK
MKRPHATHIDQLNRRGGVALIVAIICLTLTTAISVSLVRLALASHQQVEREHWRLQSAWLAESGLSRAASRLNDDADYVGEDWTTAGIGPENRDGLVTIKVAADPLDAARVVITATADFPTDPTDRVRTTRTLTLARHSDPPAPQPSED